MKFEEDKKYWMSSVMDHQAKWIFKVLKRTELTITITPVNGAGEFEKKTLRVKKMPHDGEEFVYPLGRYSMAPVLKASRGV